MNGDDALAVIKSNNQTLFTINDIYRFLELIEPKAVRSSSMKFIEESVNNFFLKTEFNGLYSYIDQDNSTSDGYRGLNITCCKIPEDNIHTYLVAFYLKFLAFPLFWKDYICIFYIALKQFSKIKSNSQSVSRIICLGESPMKIVFIQEFFFKNKFITDALITKNYAMNVSFEYFSMSRLQTGIYTLYHNIESKYSSLHTLFTATHGDFSAVNTKIIELFIGSSNLSVLVYFNVNVISNIRKQQNAKDIFDKIAGHFTHWKLNPRHILDENKPVYFEDRCESYTSVLGLIYHYIQLCNKENFTREERKQLYNLLYIVGFDYKDESTESFKQDKIKLYCINYLMYYLFCSPVPGKAYEDLTEDEKRSINEEVNIEFHSMKQNELQNSDYHFIQVNYYNKTKYLKEENQTPDEYFIAEIEKDLFFSQKDSLRKNISFLSAPEKGQYNTRCIQGVNLYESVEYIKSDDLILKSNENVKQQGDPGLNCNLFNFFIIYYLNQLASTTDSILPDMVLKFDSIDETEIFNNSTYNKDIFGSSPGSNERAKTWWNEENKKKNIKYNEQIELFREQIINDLLENKGEKNYFKDLIKMVDIQRMIGSIKYEFVFQEMDILYNKLSTIPTNNNFIYNEDYKKIFKPDVMPLTEPTTTTTTNGGLNRQKKGSGKPQTRKKKGKKIKQIKKTRKRKNYFL
jgi:hypothetical protein